MKHYVLLFIFLAFSWQLHAQNDQQQNALEYINTRGEVYFKVISNEAMSLAVKLSKVISVDKVSQNELYAYANEKQFNKFLTFQIGYQVQTPPSMLLKPVMKDKINIKDVTDWDFYPTYEAYEDMMEQFAATYPDLCELETMTTLPSGRKLLILHINNDLSSEQNEPEFLYTSTMHGDEVTGYVLMLRYIDYLLSNYGTDTRVTELVNNIDIWINPLANPDGTYAGGNNTVYGATRSNGNSVDLNRNYPDPDDGDHPDGENYQPETEAFMQLAEEHHFVMSANFHGGAEVVNYPWDTWAKLTADDDWWIYVSREYADTVHANATSGYMTELENGITNGYAWYTISGGRQDYMNYYQRCREVTIELSDNKTPPASSLPGYWNYNYRSLLNYMEQCRFGLRGVITSSETGQPMEARIFIEGHDKDHSDVYSALPVGDYHRMLKAGTYNVTYSAPGFVPKTITVTIQDGQATVQDVQLDPIQGVLADFHADMLQINPGTSINFFDDSYGTITSWNWSFPGAEPSGATVQNPQNIRYDEVGTYSVTLTVKDAEGNSNTLTKENYITVTNIYTMSNSTVEVCNGYFYDTGGASDNYNDNEDLTMTFKPAEAGMKIKAVFIEFSVEQEASCDWDYMKIYDGSNLIGTYCGTDSPGTVQATGADGSLTFVFHSDYMVNESGWKAEISCYDPTVGISENNAGDFRVFPNPASGLVHISADNRIERLTIYDISGKKIRSYSPEGKTFTLNVRSITEGVYLLKAETAQSVFNERVIIQ
jgi:PKD repeat protein